ncbi:hypothetical protein [Flagellimonas flava]|uniref:hypothetical protein n=1 Tax=Flagellimonas flava TaxID=570519 RepID=UPI003D64AF20
MKHVLLIANIDGHSPQLLRYVARLCKDLDLRLHILQIETKSELVLISSPYYISKSGLVFNSEVQDKKKILSNYVSEHTKDLIDSTWISNQLVQGNIQESLNAFINKEKIDFVIASQAVFRNTAVGQNNVFTQLLLNIADIPTLVVPNDHSYNPFRSIGYLTTLKGNDYDNMVWVRENFPKSKLNVLHFSFTEPSAIEQKKVNYLKSELGANSFTYENRAIDIEDFIAKEVKTADNEFDCLMVKTKKRNFWQRLIDPSTALNLILRIDCPTLVFKYKEEELK